MPSMLVSNVAMDLKLCDKIVHLEKCLSTINNELEEVRESSEKAFKTIRKAENEYSILSDKLGEAFKVIDMKTKETEALALANRDLVETITGVKNEYKNLSDKLTEALKIIKDKTKETEAVNSLNRVLGKDISEAEDTLAKQSIGVTNMKKEARKKEKVFNKVDKERENLEKVVEDLQNDKKDLLIKVKHCDDNYSQYKAKIAELRTLNQHPSFLFNFEYLSEWMSPYSMLYQTTNKSNHFPNFQICSCPTTFLYQSASKPVLSYDYHIALKTKHECEEFEEGALFLNYYEMVRYPDPGPCGGTSGSPVRTCPNSPNATIIVLAISEHKRNVWKRNVFCKLWTKTYLDFHMKMMHSKKIQMAICD